MSRLTENEEAVLAELSGDAEHCYNYESLMGLKGMERKELEPIIKHLRELKYIEYWRGLMTEDGEVAGSGWCRSRAGNDYAWEHKL